MRQRQQSWPLSAADPRGRPTGSRSKHPCVLWGESNRKKRGGTYSKGEARWGWITHFLFGCSYNVPLNRKSNKWKDFLSYRWQRSIWFGCFSPPRRSKTCLLTVWFDLGDLGDGGVGCWSSVFGLTAPRSSCQRIEQLSLGFMGLYLIWDWIWCCRSCAERCTSWGCCVYTNTKRNSEEAFLSSF